MGEEMIDLSIIIPVYNVEPYIEQCINSILNQDKKNIELIVVDDGGRDKSINIVRSFRDKRIKIISQPNSGLSAARNTGIKHAEGLYTMFVDSDDFISSNFSLSDMIQRAKLTNADILVANSCFYFNENKIIPYKRNRKLFKDNLLLDGKEFLKIFLEDNSMLRTVWTNIYKTQLIKENSIFFKVGILHEDELFIPQIFLKAEKTIIYDKDFYMYRQREGSIMNNKNISKRAQDRLYVCKELSGLKDEILDLQLWGVIEKHIYLLLVETFIAYNSIENIHEVIDFILTNSSSRNIKFKYIFIKNNPFLFRIIYKFRKKIQAYLAILEHNLGDKNAN